MRRIYVDFIFAHGEFVNQLFLDLAIVITGNNDFIKGQIRKLSWPKDHFSEKQRTLLLFIIIKKTYYFLMAAASLIVAYATGAGPKNQYPLFDSNPHSHAYLFFRMLLYIRDDPACVATSMMRVHFIKRLTTIYNISLYLRDAPFIQISTGFQRPDVALNCAVYPINRSRTSVLNRLAHQITQ